MPSSQVNRTILCIFIFFFATTFNECSSCCCCCGAHLTGMMTLTLMDTSNLVYFKCPTMYISNDMQEMYANHLSKLASLFMAIILWQSFIHSLKVKIGVFSTLCQLWETHRHTETNIPCLGRSIC